MKKLFIQIPEPCHEDWNKMTKVEQGRYCDSCCKEVVDFSIMNDQEILRYLSKPRGKTCGNFHPDQLNRAIMETKPPSKKWSWGVLMSFLITLAGACKQKTIGKLSVQSEQKTKTEEASKIEWVTLGEMAVEEEMIVTEKIMEEVCIKGDIIPMIPSESENTVDSFPMAAPVIDTAAIESSVYPSILQTELIGRVGGLSIIRQETVDTVPVKIIDTIKNLFVTPEVKLYPNPVMRGSRVSVKINTPSDYQVILSDNQSRIIFQSAFSITQKSQAYQLDIPPAISAGMYYVILTDKRSKKRYTEKLIIQ